MQILTSVFFTFYILLLFFLLEASIKLKGYILASTFDGKNETWRVTCLKIYRWLAKSEAIVRI